jgi:DNA-directed RNA polymerase specialized sigma24 family protein
MPDPLPASDSRPDVDFERLSKRLLAYARKRCGRLNFAALDRAVQGVGIQDLAAEGFVRALAQQHRWTNQHGPLEDFLFLEAKKYIRRTPGHLLTSTEHGTTGPLDLAVDQIQARESTPLEALVGAEGREVILASLPDEIERFIATAIMNGDDLSGSEMAAKIGVTVDKVYEAKRRLKERKAFKDLVENLLKQGAST